MARQNRMLDTGTCISMLRRTDDAVVRWLESVAIGEVAISAITQSELMFGVVMSERMEQDRAALDLLLRHVAVVEYSGAAAGAYGEIREAAELRGKKIGAHDLLVAAHARSLGLTLVTNSPRDYRELPGLGVEGWGG